MPPAAGLLIGLLITVALNFVLGAIFGGKKSPQQQQQPFTSRTVSTRQAVSPREIVLGVQLKGGVITFMALDPASNNNNLHLVITLAGNRCASIGEMYIAGTPVGLDGTGAARNPLFYEGAPLIFVEKKLGHPGEPAFPNLVAANLGWTSAHRQDGCASVHIMMIWDETAFAGFDPSQIAFDVWGYDQLYDPRSDSSGFSDNAALCVGYYLTAPTVGLASSWSTEMDDSDLDTAANLADEYVNLTPTTAPFVADPSNNFIAMMEPMQPSGGGIYSGLWAPLLGDEVQVSVSAGGTLPSPLSASATYYWIPAEIIPGTAAPPDSSNVFTGNFAVTYPYALDWLGATIASAVNTAYNTALTDATPAPDIFLGYLAASLADALAGNAIAITDAGTGTFTLAHVAERRYCTNGVFTLNQTPVDIMTGLLAQLGGSAGRAVWTGGQWSVQGGAYVPPTVSLGDGDLRKDGFSVLTQASRHDFCNWIGGTFINPASFWQQDNYPPATSSAMVSADGVLAQTSLNLPFELSASRAQRIALMELLRARSELQIPQLPCKLSALQVRGGDLVEFSHARFGWTDVVFDVLGLVMSQEQDLNQQPVLGVDLALRFTQAADYAWSPGDAALMPIAPKSSLPDPTVVAAPGAPVISEQLYQTTDATGVKINAVVTCTASPDAFVVSYLFEYAPHGTTNWTLLPPQPAAAGASAVVAVIYNIAPGVYDFRVRAQNGAGAFSAYATSTYTITPVPDPADVTGFAGVQYGALLRLTWNPVAAYLPTTYDVGFAPMGTTDWSLFDMLSEEEAGTELTVPAKPGSWTFGIRAHDIAGHLSDDIATFDLVVVNTSDVYYDASEAPAWNSDVYNDWGNCTDAVLFDLDLGNCTDAVTVAIDLGTCP